MIASCAAGAGHHGLFPVVNQPRYLRALQIARRISTMKLHEFAETVAGRLRKRPQVRYAEARRPIWFYRPGDQSLDLPLDIPGYRLLNSWTDVLRAVEAEQGRGKRLKVVCYPCAPLQSLTSTQVTD